MSVGGVCPLRAVFRSEAAPTACATEEVHPPEDTEGGRPSGHEGTLGDSCLRREKNRGAHAFYFIPVVAFIFNLFCLNKEAKPTVVIMASNLCH